MVRAEAHLQEVLDVAECGIRRYWFLLLEYSEHGGAYGWCGTQDSVDVHVSLVLRVIAESTSEESGIGFWVEGGQACYEGLEHAHGMRAICILLNCPNEGVDLWIWQRVCLDSFLEEVKLRFVW